MGGTQVPPNFNVPWTETDQKQKDQRVAASDAVMDERHAGFDLSAQDNHAKYERAHFAVVGEGTKAAFENYREGYSKINWSE